jgi:hypothetical protein
MPRTEFTFPLQRASSNLEGSTTLADLLLLVDGFDKLFVI